ncbi:MAG: glycosyltransferase family 39 protein [Myxococcota bacterium]
MPRRRSRGDRCSRSSPSSSGGYVDHPPLSVWLLRGVTETLGNSLLAIELLPALAGAATLVVIALLARELGGGRGAQICAALGGLCSLVYLVMGSFHSMNAFEPLLWALGYWLLLRILAGASPVLWLVLGAVVGLGLLSKLSMALFAIGLGVGLVVTPARRRLATPWPWLAAAVAFTLFLPHLVWQLRHDFVSFEFLSAMRTWSSGSVSSLEFAAGQLFAMSPIVAPLWIAGLAYGLLAPSLRAERPAFWIFVTAFTLLAASGSAQLYYLGPAYPIVLGAGGVAVERFAVSRRWRWLPAATMATLLLASAPLVTIALPLLPPETLVALDAAPTGEERRQTTATNFDSELPGHLALRFGWPELAEAVAAARAALPPEQREHVAVLAPSFGEAAAIDFFGPPLGLPRAIGTHNQYGLWGPRGAAGALLLVIADEQEPRIAHQDLPAGFRRGDTPRELASLCGEVERLASVDCRFCPPYVERKAVFVCRDPRQPLAEIWEDLRDTL